MIAEIIFLVTPGDIFDFIIGGIIFFGVAGACFLFYMLWSGSQQ